MISFRLLFRRVIAYKNNANHLKKLLNVKLSAFDVSCYVTAICYVLNDDRNHTVTDCYTLLRTLQYRISTVTARIRKNSTLLLDVS